MANSNCLIPSSTYTHTHTHGFSYNAKKNTPCSCTHCSVPNLKEFATIREKLWPEIIFGDFSDVQYCATTI